MQAQHFPGVVFAGGTCRLMGQIANDAGELLTPAGVESASYTIYAIGSSESDRAPVAGHVDVVLDPDEVILAQPREWDLDDVGYNFELELDIASYAAFPEPGTYLVVIVVVPVDEQSRLGGYRLRAI